MTTLKEFDTMEKIPEWLMRLALQILRLQRGRAYWITLNLSSRPEWAIMEIGDLKQ